MRFTPIIIILLLAFALPASAQIDLTPKNVKTLTVYIHGGLSAPFGELNRRAKLGGTGGLGLGFCPFGSGFPDFETIIHAQGYYFPSNPGHGDFRILMAGLDLKIRQRPPRRNFLYLLLGGGYGRASEAAHQATVFSQAGSVTVDRLERTESKYYLSAGIGIEHAVLGSSRVFFEFRVTDLSGDIIRDYVFVDVTMGIGF